MLERKQLLSTLIELAGLSAVVAGVAQFCVPAAYIVAGVALGAVGYALAPKDR